MNKFLVLGLGNEMLGDDGVGILAARASRERLGCQADVLESGLAGLALFDLFFDYERAIVIDAVHTGRRPPGTIIELGPDDLARVVAPSPHYAGFPEMLALARRLDVDFPKEICIFALEVEDPYTIGGALSAPVSAALPGLVERVCAQVRHWQALADVSEPGGAAPPRGEHPGDAAASGPGTEDDTHA